MKTGGAANLIETSLPGTLCRAAIPSDGETSGEVRAAVSTLSESESVRAERFRFREDYLSYITAHALLRRCLSDVDRSVSPEGWIFAADSYGKPILDESMGRPRLHFSLSRTRTLVVCAVSTGGVCGVDVEDTRRIREPSVLAKSVFSDVENSDIAAHCGRMSNVYFTQLWCLKEAFLKAKGVGLSVPLDNFYFRLEPGNEIPAVFEPPPGDTAENWRFQLIRPDADHVIALALGAADGDNGAHR